MREAQPDYEFNWDRVADGLDTAATTERGNDHSNESVTFSHLLRFEKKALLQPKPKFIDILYEGLSEEEKDKITNIREERISQMQKLNLKSYRTSIKPKITLIPESDHESDHKSNIRELIKMINDRHIDNNTVICLERKEYGANFGMQDVSMLASLIEYNQKNPDAVIAIPTKIQNSLIYQDAILYNTAKRHGIEITGIEGKESTEYNFTREAHMAKSIKKISATGRNVIFPVGATHIDRLKSRLPSAQISQEIEKSKNRVKLDLVVSQIRKGLQKSQISTNIKDVKISSRNSKSFSR